MHTLSGENPLTFTQVIIRKCKWMDIWQADGHTDSQCDTIIPHHYRVAGYKNDHFIQTKIHRLYRKMTIYGHFSNGHFSTNSIHFLFGYNTFKFTFKSSYIWNLTMNRLIKRSQCTKICCFFFVFFFFLNFTCLVIIFAKTKNTIDSLSRLCLSQITADLEVKSWSLF